VGRRKVAINQNVFAIRGLHEIAGNWHGKWTGGDRGYQHEARVAADPTRWISYLALLTPCFACLPRDCLSHMECVTSEQKTGKLATQVLLDVLGVERLESPIVRLLEQDRNRHDLTGIQARGSDARQRSRGQQLLLPPGRAED
jgi:hypothetical protein